MSGPLGGSSPGRKRNKGKGMFPGRPAESKVKRGKVPPGVYGQSLGGGAKRGTPPKKGCLVSALALAALPLGAVAGVAAHIFG